MQHRFRHGRRCRRPRRDLSLHICGLVEFTILNTYFRNHDIEHIFQEPRCWTHISGKPCMVSDFEVRKAYDFGRGGDRGRAKTVLLRVRLRHLCLFWLDSDSILTHFSVIEYFWQLLMAISQLYRRRI